MDVISSDERILSEMIDWTRDRYCAITISGTLMFRIGHDTTHSGLHDAEKPALQHEGIWLWVLNGRILYFDHWCDKLKKTDNEKSLLLIKYGQQIKGNNTQGMYT